MTQTARRSAFGFQQWVASLRAGKRLYRLGELARLAGHSPQAARRSTQRLAARGWLVRVGKGLYANMLHPQGPPTVEDIAGVVYPPSCVSLSSVLFADGIVDQAPHLLTCVTTNKTKRTRTGLGEIQYQQLKPALFFGYGLERGVPRARPEKAALDFMYVEFQSGRHPVLDEWNWEELDQGLLQRWAASYPSSVRRLVGVYVEPS